MNSHKSSANKEALPHLLALSEKMYVAFKLEIEIRNKIEGVESNVDALPNK